MKLELTPLQMKAMQAAQARAASAVSLYRPTPQQEEVVRAFERDDVIEVLLGGGNRAGKSLLAATMIASAIKDESITFNDGSKHSMIPERWKGEPLKIWIIGFDWQHIGATLHRLLFKPGAFRVVKEGGKMRPVNPHKDPKRIRKPAPAFIQPESDVVGGEDGISWENKKDYQLRAFTFPNGTRVEFYPSTGALKAGDPVHIAWIDEHIDNDRWYDEIKSRLIDDEGKVLWTSWPDTEPSEAMSALEDRANEGKPGSFYFVLSGEDNPFTQGKHRENILGGMSADMQTARNKGIMNKDRWRVYPQFSQYIHCALGKDPANDDSLARTIRASGGIPANWTRYLILDPGTKSPAILYVAYPPPELGDFIVPYAELNLHYTSARPLAEAAAAMAGIVRNSDGQIIDHGEDYEEFIADFHAFRRTPEGFDGTVGQNYEKYFAEFGLKCRRHGNRFTSGSDNITVRQMSVQGTMNLRDGRPPRLRIMVDRCPVLVRQLENARWGRWPNGEPTEEQNKYQPKDVQQCLEYAISRRDCGYVLPRVRAESQATPFDLALKSIGKIFGRQNNVKSDERTVFCGAGKP